VTSPEHPSTAWAPRPAALWAWLVFAVAALALTWPVFTGQFLAGDDQLIAGYAFREFGAEFFREHGRIPEWNPYLFGGMPFIAAMHGDIFYPTAWLRWIVPTDLGMSLGFVIHLAVAGGAMYALLRGLRLSWTASVVGGLAYLLSGSVASTMRPGHDGKLFVAALAPLALLALLRGIRHGRLGGHGALALIVGLAMLSPHFQTTYYLLVACGLWALWLTFLDPERDRGRAPVADLAGALGGVLLGVGIGMIQGLPFLKYIPYSPRTAGSASSGWDYATSYAMPLDELPSTVLPQFNGLFEHYWGSNFFKTNSEYLGALVLILAILGFREARRRGLALSLGAIAGLFLLVAFGGHTPFYRLWYTIMPMMDKVRAAGMAFYLPTLVVAVWAALGVDRLLRGEVDRRRLILLLSGFGGFALLGVIGVLQPVTETLADPRVASRAVGNAGELRVGSVRLLLFVVTGGVVLWATAVGRLRGGVAALALLAVIGVDNWSVLRHYSQFVPAAATTYADDTLVSRMKQSPMPFRNLDAAGIYGEVGVYQGSWLMAERVPTVFGYHGNEIRFYDELWGTKNQWDHQLSPSLWDLWAVRYVTLAVDPGDQLAGYHRVLGPTAPSPHGSRQAAPAWLYERDEAPTWVRVVPHAVRAPADQIIPTIVDPRFPTDRLVLVSDTGSIPDAVSSDALPADDGLRIDATLTDWEPGRMTIALEGATSRTNYLLVAENWYPGWQAVVDGTPAATWRGNHAMLTVALPPGAREVALTFVTPGYATGKLITALSLLAALALIVAGYLRRRGADA
jgi:hypothetical protein